MAQFDVHRNKGALRDSIPFVMDVQSAQFDGYRRRVVPPPGAWHAAAPEHADGRRQDEPRLCR